VLFCEHRSTQATTFIVAPPTLGLHCTHFPRPNTPQVGPQSVQYLHQLLAQSLPRHVPGVLACVHMYMLWGATVGRKLHETGVSYAGADECNRRQQTNLTKNTCMRGWEGVGSWGFFSLSIVGACCLRGGLCFGRGRDRGLVLYIFVLLRVVGWWVLVYAHTHTQTT